jgi:hypothetical protein
MIATGSYAKSSLGGWVPTVLCIQLSIPVICFVATLGTLMPAQDLFNVLNLTLAWTLDRVRLSTHYLALLHGTYTIYDSGHVIAACSKSCRVRVFKAGSSSARCLYSPLPFSEELTRSTIRVKRRLLVVNRVGCV